MNIAELTLDPSELDAFIASKLRNSHVYIGPYQFYLRKGHHVVNGQLLKPTFDIGSVGSEDEDHMENGDWLPTDQRPSRGQFAEAVKLIEQRAKAGGYVGVFVESINNRFLPEVLERYGYSRVKDAVADVHYFKPV